MMNNLFCFSGILVFKEDNNILKVEGEFDIFKKESVFNSQSILNFSNIIFKNRSLFICKVSSQNERLKRIESLEFIFDIENNCYISQVFIKKNFIPKPVTEKIKKDRFIKKDSTSRYEIGIITLQILNKDLLDYGSVKERFYSISERKIRREESHPYY